MYKQRKKKWLLLVSFFFLFLPILLLGETNALFTDEATSPNNHLTTATLDVSVSPAPIFNVSNLVPGDVVVRTVTVQNDGTVPFSYSIQASSNNSLLWTDQTNGLQLSIVDGTTTYFNGAISDLNVHQGPNLLLPPGEKDDLQFTISFPVTADNTFQNLAETIVFTIQAIQLPGTSR
ncbi:CalY family protein [Anoxybacteroides rupiense]|uniref:CalY family protein n=1 Tax=Anoxybacteroides rupiense TaxID=311460 RepID=UPI001F08AE01|nr:CalY family protein [Anoxybacillus rupiensis]